MVVSGIGASDIISATVGGAIYGTSFALLYLNNKVPWPGAIGHNTIATNAVLALILLLFVAVGGWETLTRLGLRSSAAP